MKVLSRSVEGLTRGRCSCLSVLLAGLTLTGGGETHAVDAAVEDLWRRAFVDTKVWEEPNFGSLFELHPLDRGAEVARAQCKEPPAMGGGTWHAATARLVKGKVHSLSLVILDAGQHFGYQGSHLPAGSDPKQAMATFDETLAKRKADWIEFLQTDLGGKLLGESQLGERSGIGMKADYFQIGNVTARVAFWEKQLLIMDLFANETSAKSLRSWADLEAKKNPLDFVSHLQISETNERSIQGIPMLAQGNRGYCGAAVMAMLGHYLGLQLGAEEVAALSGFVYGQAEASDPRDLLSAIGREALVKTEKTRTFDFRKAQKSIDLGMPVLVFRRWSQDRDYVHTLHAMRRKAGEPSQLPEPGMTDRKTWPTKSDFAHASIINGYCDKTREVIFTESWAQEARDRRMRAEEMEGTCYFATYFLPR